jgi:hypothetical protein
MGDLLEILAEDAHKGRMGEWQRQGYADHPLNEFSQCYRNDCSFTNDRHHADMRPWSELPDHLKEYDRATVKSVLDSIERLGYMILKMPKEIALTITDVATVIKQSDDALRKE